MRMSEIIDHFLTAPQASRIEFTRAMIGKNSMCTTGKNSCDYTRAQVFHPRSRTGAA